MIAWTLTSACETSASRARASAKTLFASYDSLAAAFDPAVADLYCDNALIQNTRRFPNGETRVMEFPAADYKRLIRVAMPVAQARADYNTYSEVEYAQEGGNVRITATRFSLLKGYASPLSILVGPCAGDSWAILEEISESRP